MKNRVVETCEMCASEVKDPTTIKVEGALLRVCSRCTQFGNEVTEPKSRSSSSRSTPSSASKNKKEKSSKRSSSKKTKKRRSSKREEDEKVLVPDYGTVIRKARMKKKLTQEQLSRLTGISVAYVRSIEAEKIEPTERVATKLERQLDIKLYEKLEPQLEYQEQSSNEGTTVGDIVSIKRLEFD